MKTIPDASVKLIEEAGLFADRLSINIELPTDEGVEKFAPQKHPARIREAMGDLRMRIDDAAEPTLRTRTTRHFVPAGQSTQMIIGADTASDATILGTSAGLPSGYNLRRVYCSAFSPIPDASRALHP